MPVHEDSSDYKHSPPPLHRQSALHGLQDLEQFLQTRPFSEHLPFMLLHEHFNLGNGLFLVRFRLVSSRFMSQVMFIKSDLSFQPY